LICSSLEGWKKVYSASFQGLLNFFSPGFARVRGKGIHSMHMTQCFFIRVLTCLILTILFVSIPKISFTEDTATLDEVIDGFDDSLTLNISKDINEEREGEDGIKDRIDDDILEGFDDEAEDATELTSEEESGPSLFSLDGYFKLGSSYNIAHDAPKQGETDWRGLSRLIGETKLELKARFSSLLQARLSCKCFYDLAYLIRGRNEFTDEVLESYEKEFEPYDVYLLGTPLKSLDIKVGRQIVVWGKSDNIRVTDVLNPLDLREPGITDIENLRLPVTATRLDYYIKEWNITGIAIHEIRFNKAPEYGNDFYPADALQSGEKKIKHVGKNTEYAVAVNGIFSKWDISFYLANIYNDIPSMELVLPGPIPEYKMIHARLKMAGFAFNLAIGNWLVKTEAAYFNGLKFFNSTDKEYSRVDILGGVEYSGFIDTIVSLEAVNRRINEFDNIIKQPPDNATENEFQWALRLTRKFLNETLNLTYLALIYDLMGQGGALQRFSAEYDIMDALEISGGVVVYGSGNLVMFRDIGKNDRLFIEIKYSF